jgi:preprotein translocase subunit YajC
VDQQAIFLIIGLVLLGVMMFLPQFQARRRRQKQMAELQIGSKIMTAGGIIGKLTYINAEQDRARVAIAPGVEITIVLAAISRTLVEDAPDDAPSSTAPDAPEG